MKQSSELSTWNKWQWWTNKANGYAKKQLIKAKWGVWEEDTISQQEAIPITQIA